MTEIPTPNSFKLGPDDDGRFGLFGGRFVAETLMPIILDLEAAYKAAKTDESFLSQLADLQTHYTGRPSPLYFAERLTEHFGGARVYFKREELNHTGSHKINNCLGQICSRAAWARRVSSPKPARGSMALPPPPSARASACRASSSWARRMSSARSPMSFA